MNKLFKIFSKYQIIILSLLFVTLFLIFILLLLKAESKYYLTAKFADTGPLYKDMPVYYKGYLIGKIKKVRLSDDYQYSLVNIEFYPKKPIFYDNIVAKAKKLETKDDYIDLIYPDPPTNTLLKDGGVIEGRGAFDMDLLLSDVADAEIMLPLFEHLSDVLVSANQTTKEIKSFFSDSRSILKDNRQNIKHTTESLNKITTNFSVSFDKDKLHNTASSVEKSAANIQVVTESAKNIAHNVDCATRNLDKTMEKVDSTLCEAHAVTTNARVITGGFRQVLAKRFAGLRIIFGKPLDKDKCSQNCSR